MKLMIYIFILSLLMLTQLSCSQQEDSNIQKIRPVKSMVINEASSTITRNFPAKVEAYKVADLAFQVAGEIIEFPVKQGEEVKKTALLAKLDPREYQDRVDEFQAKYDLAKVQFGRAEKLVVKHYVSEEEFDKKRTAMNVAATNLQTAKKDLADSVLHAPFDGVIALTYVENHENIKAKQNILRIQDISKLDIVIDVPEDVMVNLTRDNKVEPIVIFRTLSDKTFPLVYKEHASQADPNTQTYRVELTMVRPEDTYILPGMSATVQVDLPDFQSKTGYYFTLPSSAVFQLSDNKNYIWLVNQKTMTVHKNEVKVSKLIGQDIEIISGVKAGDRVVTAGVHYLNEGEKVTLMNKNEQR